LEVDDQKVMEEDYVPSGVQEMFAERRKWRAHNDFTHSQPGILKGAMFAGALFIVLVYFQLPMSYVKGISVSGNTNLSTDYIKEISNIDTNTRFFLTIPFISEMRLKSNPMIADAKVKLTDNHIVSIEVTEKKAVGYRYDGDTPKVLLSDNTTADLDSGYLDIIANIPLITGFDDAEQTRQLCNAFADVEPNVIADISEITQYELPYDDQTLKVLMRTGGYFISNYHDFHLVNQYHLVVKKVSDSAKCVFAFSGDTGDTVYTRTCPWDEAASTNEYWKDANGTEIKNAYGDKVVKHYYTDESGNTALDSSGNKIAIPIDSDGVETPDAKFQEHYAAGYYATGTLVLPEGAE
jgi:cell division septal protein FtsQ